jgi:hypothetical protein
MEAQSATMTFTQAMQQVRDQTIQYTEGKYNTRQTPQIQGRQRTMTMADYLGQR